MQFNSTTQAYFALKVDPKKEIMSHHLNGKRTIDRTARRHSIGNNMDFYSSIKEIEACLEHTDMRLKHATGSGIRERNV
jgi:hypothetical protein